MQARKDWGSLVRSIRRGRAPNGRFFKPVCVIAAIDLADLGRLDSDMLHSRLILRQFSEYLMVTLPHRASSGWQPLWFLSNDGLWKFFRKGKLVEKQSFEGGMPRTGESFLRKFDTQSISSDYRELWDSAQSRQQLRGQMLLMLAEDPDSRTLVRQLLNPDVALDPERWRTDEEVDRLLAELSGQRDFFLDQTVDSQDHEEARGALLKFDPDTLPGGSAAAPQFEATGVGPIRLRADLHRRTSPVQAELYEALVTKCRDLEQLADAANNRAAHIRPALQSLLRALGGLPDDANSYLVWAYGNTLRRLNDADIRSRLSKDPDAPPLPERLAELLSDLVEHFNVYAWGDELLAAFDRARLGPAGRAEVILELGAGRNLVRAIQATPGIMDEAAVDVVAAASQSAEQAAQVTGPDADQALANALEAQRSGARAILRSAYLQARQWLKDKSKSVTKAVAEGALKQMGAEAVKGLTFVSFVNVYRQYLEPLWRGAAESDIVVQLLNLLRRLFP